MRSRRLGDGLLVPCRAQHLHCYGMLQADPRNMQNRHPFAFIVFKTIGLTPSSCSDGDSSCAIVLKIGTGSADMRRDAGDKPNGNLPGDRLRVIVLTLAWTLYA